jgi:calcium permeable stress-gated cation channel
MFLVARERLILIGIRQAYTSSRYNASRLSSRVVLFLSVPKEALQKDKLHDVFGSEAQESWPVLELNDLEDLVSERDDKAMKLESAEVKLSRNANKKRLAKSKNSDSGSHENGDASDLIDEKSRPKHRLKPLIGTKVDTINWAREALPDLADRIQKLRENPTGGEENRSAVFVSFSTQAAAQRACQQIQFHPQLPTKLPTQLPTFARYLDVQPKEAIWGNLTLKPSLRVSRAFAAWVFVIAIIIFWSIPIGIVGTLTNINYLTDKLHFLRFINNLPTPILGLITGLLPPYLMSTFVSYVPKFFRCKPSLKHNLPLYAPL